MSRIIDISQDGYHLSRYRGFMKFSKDNKEIARIALDDIAAIIVHSHGITYSNSLLIELANRGTILVLCGSNHFPIGYLGAINGHHAQSRRIRDQISAKVPLKKQLWRQLVIQKIKMQGSMLKAQNLESKRLEMLARQVKSGDPSNIEAQAARYYWSRLMWKGFRRDRGEVGANAMLNYGYTVLRAAVARAIIAAGFHPSIGIHHKNQTNGFVLADDLIEPFRPIVDYSVKSLLNHGLNEINPDSKRALTSILEFDLNVSGSRSPVTTAIKLLCQSLVSSYASGKPQLVFADIPSPIELTALGVDSANFQ